MQRLGNTASKYAKGMKSLAPGEDEAAGIKATQQNVNEATQPPATPPARIGGTEMLHPGAKYGSRPGEKRLDSQGNIIPVMDEGGDVGIDAGRKASAQGDATVQGLLDSPDEVTAPVNSGTAAPAAADFSGMAKLGQGIADMKRPADNATAPQYMQPTNAQLYPNAPVAPQNAVIPGYDTGGDVALNGVSGNAPTKLPIGGKAPEKKATGGVSGNAPTTLPVGGKTMRDSHDVTPTITPSAPLPTYDKGGPVDVNDGQHQLAILKHGEKVLNPKEADAYRAGQQAAVQMAPPAAAGAPADFPGRVMANPDNVQPVADTDIQPEVDPIDPSAQMSTQNAPLETPQGDISNTPGVDVNAKQKPAAPDPHVAQAAANEYGQGEKPPEEPEVKGTEAERKAIEVDKQKAMGQGIPGLVPLGLAKIHENQLSAQPKHLPAMEGEPKVFDNGGDVKAAPGTVDLSEHFRTGMVSPSRYSYVPTMTPEAPRPSVDFQGGRYPVVNNVDTGRPGQEIPVPKGSYSVGDEGVDLSKDYKFKPAPTMAEDSSKLSTQELGQGMAHADYLPPIPARPIPQALRTYDEGGDVALTPEQLATVKAHELQTQANMVVPGKAASDQSVTQPIARVGMPQMTAAAPAEVKQPSRMPVPAAEPAPQVKPTSPGMPQMTAQAAPTMATPTYGGPGKAVPQGQMIPAKQLPQDEYKAKLAAYDTQIQAALDTATPEGKETADRLALAKQNFQHKNPWGSEGNHPGFLGKMAHIGAKIGNIAGDVLAPKTMELIPGTDLNKMQQGANAQAQVGKDTALETARAAEEAKADTDKATVGKTTQEQTYHDLLTGNNGQPRINPDTNVPYTAQEANVASQGTGKGTEELYIQDQMRGIDPTSGKHYTRQQAEENYLQMKAGNKAPNEQERRVKDYLESRGLPDNPANRENARTAIKASDTTATQQAALPFSEQKAKFNDNLTTARELLVQQNADANTRGEKADELQNTENARDAKVNAQFTAARDALNATDEQFANQIVPITTLLAITSAEGVKRVNKQELDKFVPSSGSFGRWIEAHADQFLEGKIPDEYRTEVGHMLDRMDAAESVEHKINTQSVDETIRQGAQTPVQKPEGGAKATPEKSKPKAAPEPGTVPAGATPGRDAKGNIIGYRAADGQVVKF